MANFVTPPVPLRPYEERIVEFKGLNRKTYVEEGEMSDMWNLTADKYPYIVQRPLRGSYTIPSGVLRPLHIISKNNIIAMIAMMDDEGHSIKFFYGDTEKTITGLSTNDRMVAINNKICFFPLKKYVIVNRDGTVGDAKSIELINNTVETATTIDDVPYYDSLEVVISNTQARVRCAVPNPGFVYDDVISIEGTIHYTPSGSSTETTADCNVTCWIEKVSGRYLYLPRETFIELTGEGATSISIKGTGSGASYVPASIKRVMPTSDLNHVVEWNNRLWGVSDADNCIYACKLGDPTNWQYYQGTSMDSYAATQGTDGDWTGAAVYSGHIIFLKQDSMARVYGTAPSNFQVTNTKCFGCEDGSRKSVVTINDKVFWKSTIGIMAYDGGIPYCISDKFNETFFNVIAGTEGRKYYASCQKQSGGYELMVLDITKAMWHKEDRTRYRDCCTMDNRLYYIEYDDDQQYCSDHLYVSDDLIVGSDDLHGDIKVANPLNPAETYEGMYWMAVFGPFDEYIENRKIYSKILFRTIVYSQTSINVYISLDEGPWELVRSYTSGVTSGHMIPIVPRRCDRYSIKIEGTGKCEIKSLTRSVRKGSHGKL